MYYNRKTKEQEEHLSATSNGVNVPRNDLIDNNSYISDSVQDILSKFLGLNLAIQTSSLLTKQ